MAALCHTRPRMSGPLAGTTVVSLRPAGAHDAMRRAAESRGATLLPLSPWRLQPRDDARTRAALAAALGAPRVVFTSPMAVAAAARLEKLLPAPGAAWLAVGNGTAAALREAGIAAVAPARMDSEGLLALAELQHVNGLAVGLVTAPGGRGEIAPALQRRGAHVLRADVYERIPVAPEGRALEALRALQAPAWIALSSGAALETLLATLAQDDIAALQRAGVLAASERLAALARQRGFTQVVVAASAMPEDLLTACPRPPV